MARDLERLINNILLLIACAGAEGVIINDAITIIQDTLNEQTGNLSKVAPNSLDGGSPPAAVITVWQWMVARRDVSVGSNREFNATPINDLLISSATELCSPGATSQSANCSTVHSTEQQTVRVSIAEETVWELLTGHGVDHKRIPHLEWVLLRAIANTKADGVLQGDLGRMVEQDKRSVPKRTDVLVAKGHIIKRTTLLRGTKTSKLWLKSFAPPSLKDENRNNVQAEMILTQQLLLDNLDTVPWHVRWTGEIIDSTALLTTIMALCKAWGVIRLSDLKAKLGILTLKWQMKIVAKICRFLNARGAIEYVAAKLNNRVYKDCMRYNRDLTARDWSIFLATGKRMTKWAREGGQEVVNNDKEPETEPNAICSITVVATTPAWQIDFPLSALITTSLRLFLETGLTNPEVCCFTIGSSFSRYISSFTSSISAPNVQPTHLKHLQVRSEHFRSGKISAYRYSLCAENTGNEEIRNTMTSAITDSYGFFETVDVVQHQVSLSELCGIGASLRKKRGRPKKYLTERLGSYDHIKDGHTDFRNLNHEGDSRSVESSMCPETPIETISDEEKRSSKVRNNQSATLSKPEGLSLPETAASESEPILDLSRNGDVDLPSTSAPRLRGRGGGRGRPRGRPIKNGGSSEASGARQSQSSSWQCEKCGGTWKNDIGLKYHLEKSRTSCNPAFNADDVILAKKQTIDTAWEESTNLERRLAEEEDEAQRPPKMRVRQKPVTLSDQQPPDDLRERTSTRLVSSDGRRSLSAAPEAEMYRQPIVNSSALLIEGPMQRQISIKVARTPRLTGVSTPEPTYSIKQEKIQHTATPCESVDGTFSPPASSLPPLPKATRPKASILSRESINVFETVVKGLLDEHDGVFAGEASLYQAVRNRWTHCGTDEPCPVRKEINSALKAMLKQKQISEHWHGFRSNNGAFARCQVISWPSVDAFDPKVLNVLGQIKLVYPEPLHMDHDGGAKTSTGPSHSYRRVLAAGVAVLSAPVYAEQAAKRKTNNPKQDNLSHAKKPRNTQKMYKSIDFGDRAPARTRRARALWGLQETNPGGQPSGLTALSDTMVALQIPVNISEEIPKHDLSASVELVQRVQEMSSRTDAYFLEDLAATLYSRCWAPSTKYFISVSQLGDRQDTQLTGDVNPKSWFDAKIKECMKLETRHAAAIVDSLQHDEQANNSIFISFFGGASASTPIRNNVDWKTLDENLERVADDESSSSEDEVDEKEGDLDIQFIDPGLRTEPPDESQEQRRTVLTTRALTEPSLDTSLAEHGEDAETSNWPFNQAEMLAAFVAVRTLLGGTEKLVDWGLLTHLYPEIGVFKLRRFWTNVKTEHASFLSKFTSVFQEKVIAASSIDELPLPDFDDTLSYDWPALIRWTMDIPLRETFSLPLSRSMLSFKYELHDSESLKEDWREKYYQVQSSVLSRYELAAAESASITTSRQRKHLGFTHASSELSIAKSWVRSLCSASDDKYTPEEVKERLNAIGHGDVQKSSSLLKQAVEELTREKVICRVKVTPSQGRPYRLNDSYSTTLTKLAQKEKYKDAADFKVELDAAFVQDGCMEIPYNLNDGAVMALTNLVATGRICLSKLGVPNVPFGFEPGNYESRKYSKSLYHFELVAKPSKSYQHNEDIALLHDLDGDELPTRGPGRELPQWMDIFGEIDRITWCDILGAFCFVLAMRGSMTIDGICSALSPILQPFEAQLIMRWGLASGVLDIDSDSACTVGEWWWLAVSYFM